jgi:hypothetical protein
VSIDKNRKYYSSYNRIFKEEFKMNFIAGVLEIALGITLGILLTMFIIYKVAVIILRPKYDQIRYELQLEYERIKMEEEIRRASMKGDAMEFGAKAFFAFTTVKDIVNRFKK